MQDAPSSKAKPAQARYWIATIPDSGFDPTKLPAGCIYIRGQLETGAETSFVHWQLLVVTERKRRLAWLRDTFGPYHFEPTRSAAANDYVWKEDTRVAGSQFELGKLPFNRASRTDWDAVYEAARSGSLGDIPSDVRVRCYHQLRRIASDSAQPVALRRTATVYWGPTEVGKSHRAEEEAGPGYFPKDPDTKWFGGYRGQSAAVIDEFRGAIPVTHLLRWFDRYPLLVEDKGIWVPMLVERWYITSNVHPREWYPGLDQETLRALLRRMRIVYIPLPLHDRPLTRDREDETLLPPTYEEAIKDNKELTP